MVERITYGPVKGELEGRHTCKGCGDPIGVDDWVMHHYTVKGGYQGSYCSWECGEGRDKDGKA